jgi:hypothetical protein
MSTASSTSSSKFDEMMKYLEAEGSRGEARNAGTGPAYHQTSSPKKSLRRKDSTHSVSTIHTDGTSLFPHLQSAIDMNDAEDDAEDDDDISMLSDDKALLSSARSQESRGNTLQSAHTHRSQHTRQTHRSSAASTATASTYTTNGPPPPPFHQSAGQTAKYVWDEDHESAEPSPVPRSLQTHLRSQTLASYKHSPTFRSPRGDTADAFGDDMSDVTPNTMHTMTTSTTAQTASMVSQLKGKITSLQKEIQVRAFSVFTLHAFVVS